jgi:hypothetical protein
MELSEQLVIVFTVPESHADQAREAMGRAGAGVIGNYSYCSFSIKGVGRFKPGTEAKPFIGETGSLEEVIEEQIETICTKDKLASVLKAIRKAHPYEEPYINIFPAYREIT